MRARVLVVALGVGLLAVPGAITVPPASASAASGAATVSDVIVGFTFVLGSASLNVPDQPLRIRTGDTVEWTNLDPISHSVAFDAMPDSLYLKKPGDKGSVQFTQAGYFTYRCNEHPEFPGMKGLVFVSDDAGNGS